MLEVMSNSDEFAGPVVPLLDRVAIVSDLPKVLFTRDAENEPDAPLKTNL